MSLPVRLATASGERGLADLAPPLDLAALVPGRAGWEVEIGFGKGRYLLRRAAGEPELGFLGIEVAPSYHRMVAERLRRRELSNVIAVRGEAQTVLATVLPRAFARAVHVYFPDPWPKSRHERRRLFAAESVDLVLGLLRPGGTLWFATDFLAYGEAVAALLAGHPRAEVRRLDGGWPEGPRTNYEIKYVAEGRPILRLAVEWRGSEGGVALHPAGARGLLAAYRPPATAASSDGTGEAG